MGCRKGVHFLVHAFLAMVGHMFQLALVITVLPTPFLEPSVLPTLQQHCRTVSAELFKLRWYAGEKLYIHCSSGNNLACVVGACLLGSVYGVHQEEALQRVQLAFALRQDPSAGQCLQHQAHVDLVRECLKRV
jgi:ABC-type uncharacterized transport system YnjBCD ATPase subunit